MAEKKQNRVKCSVCGNWVEIGKILVSVRYLGNKSIKHDTLCESGTVWHGPGDVQKVPEPIAQKLATFDKVWEIVGREEVVETKFSKCLFVKKDGSPCGAYAKSGEELCGIHLKGSKVT